MSAAPLPRPDGDAGSDAGTDAEGWALLDAMRRRLDEQLAQTRKTAAQVTQLADSIAALVDLQRKRARSLNLNSFVAYVVFTVLCGGAFYFLYQSRARELVSGRDRSAVERDAAIRHADEASAKLAARDAADSKAWETYQLLAAGKRDDAAKHLAALRDAPLSRFERDVLTERAKQADVVQVDGALKTATAAFRTGHYADVGPPLERALAIETSGPRAAQIHYLIGIAQAKLGELDKAIAHLQRSLELDVADEDARFQLASALDRAGQWGKARAEYDRFATAKPQSPFAVFAMRRSATLARMPAVMPQAPINGAPTVAPKPAAPNLAPAKPTALVAPAPAPPVASRQVPPQVKPQAKPEATPAPTPVEPAGSASAPVEAP